MNNKSLTDDLNRIMIVLAIVIGALFSYHFAANVIKAMHIKQTTATIVDVYDEYTFPNKPDEVQYSFYAEFTADGQVYSKMLTIFSDTPLKNGDTLEISYDDNEPERYVAPMSSYRNNILIAAFAAAACVFCIVSNRKYFRGYYKDFVLKHKKAVIFTLVDVIAAVVVGVGAHIRSNAPDLVGFEGMGIALLAMLLIVIAAIALIVVWTVGIVKCAKQYKLEIQGGAQYSDGILANASDE